MYDTDGEFEHEDNLEFDLDFFAPCDDIDDLDEFDYGWI